MRRGLRLAFVLRNPFMMNDLAEWDVLVGRVSGRWDKALLKVAPYSSHEAYYAKGAQLCLKVGPHTPTKFEPRLLTVQSVRRQGKHVLLDCGFAGANEVDALNGAELFVHPAMRPPLPPDEFYLDDILGMRIVTEEGADLGEIEEIIETPANNVYVTPHAMIPAVPAFILKTDWEARILTIKDMPGLRYEPKPSVPAAESVENDAEPESQGESDNPEESDNHADGDTTV